jgi:alkenylglycerophosphocholine/alkenylglycerophosphoethanolamine hydrolase
LETIPVYFLFVIFAITLVNWIAAALEKRELYFASKPLVLIVLMLFYTQAGGLDQIRLPFLIALFFSLLGDIFLIPRSTRWFVAGMLAFLIAHLVYIWAFSHWPVSPGAALPVIAAGAILLAALTYLVLTKTKNKPEFKRMRFAFILYGSVLTTMTVVAVLCLWRPAWPKWSGALAALGGLFFFVSDSILGLEKMGKRLPATRLLVISTYHIAQMLIISSTLGL